MEDEPETKKKHRDLFDKQGEIESDCTDYDSENDSNSDDSDDSDDDFEQNAFNHNNAFGQNVFAKKAVKKSPKKAFGGGGLFGGGGGLFGRPAFGQPPQAVKKTDEVAEIKNKEPQSMFRLAINHGQ